MKVIIYATLEKLFPNLYLRRRINGDVFKFPIRYARYYPENYDIEKFSFIKKFSKGIAVDLGAHIGLFTVLLAKHCEKVISFEPTKTTLDILERTVRMNGLVNVTLRPELISDSNGIVNFYQTAADASNSNSITEVGERVSVQSVTLDSLNLNFDFIKMDIEGAEILALEGAKEILASDHAMAMAIEVHPIQIRNLKREPGEIWQILKNSGFEIFKDGRVLKESEFNDFQDCFEIQCLRGIDMQ